MSRVSRQRQGAYAWLVMAAAGGNIPDRFDDETASSRPRQRSLAEAMEKRFLRANAGG